MVPRPSNFATIPRGESDPWELRGAQRDCQGNSCDSKCDPDSNDKL